MKFMMQSFTERRHSLQIILKDIVSCKADPKGCMGYEMTHQLTEVLKQATSYASKMILLK